MHDPMLQSRIALDWKRRLYKVSSFNLEHENHRPSLAEYNSHARERRGYLTEEESRRFVDDLLINCGLSTRQVRQE